jgi:hypothetical protein
MGTAGFGGFGFSLLAAFNKVKDLGGITPPVPDLNLQIEIDLGIQDVLDFAARLDADFLDHLAVPAEDDGPMVVALDEDRGTDVSQLPLFFSGLRPRRRRDFGESLLSTRRFVGRHPFIGSGLIAGRL